MCIQLWWYTDNYCHHKFELLLDGNAMTLTLCIPMVQHCPTSHYCSTTFSWYWHCTSLLVPCVTMTVLPPLTNVNLPSNKWQNCTYGSQQSNQWTLIHTAVANTIQSTYWQKDCDGVGPIMHAPASMLLSLHSNMAAGHQEWPFFHHLAMPGIVWCSHTTSPKIPCQSSRSSQPARMRIKKATNCS